MSPTPDPVTLTLARLRKHGHLPVAGLPLGDLEHRADPAGRQVLVIEGGEDEPLLALGWQESEPAASTQAPCLARRTLSPTETKVLVVVYALLTDPQTDRIVIKTNEVMRQVEMLTGQGPQSASAWVIPALEQTLPGAGLIMAVSGGWRAGPRMQVWDAVTRDVMAHAARRLWEHPSWQEASDAR